MTLATALTSAIMRGAFDEDLDRLADLLRQRQVLVAQRLLMTLRVGDKVRFNYKTRPVYLRGKQGIILAVHGTSAAVQIEFPIGKFRTGHPIMTPATLLEKV